MANLPNSGRIDCSRCFPERVVKFDNSTVTQGDWRITANPLAWGNASPKVVVLGFSKGPTQAGALLNTPHDEIACKGGRTNVGKILSHLGILKIESGNDYSSAVSAAISDTTGPFHFASMIRCTVERFDHKDNEWKGSGGGMLDKFIASDFGAMVASNCVKQHLCGLPPSTRLVVLFGMGHKLNYVKSAYKLFESARGGNWRWLNEIAYTDENIVVVHVEHFASQGKLVPEWLDATCERGRYGVIAKEAVDFALSGTTTQPVRSWTTKSIPLETTIKGGVSTTTGFSKELAKLESTQLERFSYAFCFVLNNGTVLYPVRMKNRTTGKSAFRVSRGGTGGNKKENGMEVESEAEMVNYALNLGYSVRAMSLDRKTFGLYKRDGRSVVDVRVSKGGIR